MPRAPETMEELEQKKKKKKKELHRTRFSPRFILRSWTIFIGKLTVYANQTLRLQAYNNQSRKNCDMEWQRSRRWQELLGEEGGLSARLELDETIKFEETCKENIAAERSVSESSREA